MANRQRFEIIIDGDGKAAIRALGGVDKALEKTGQSSDVLKGVMQGVGQALLEGASYDESGQLLSGSFMDYTMPRADNLPNFTVDTTVTECPSNPLGMKGCGEAGAIASPPAIINAITDALGHEDLEMPATPQTVWRAAQKTAQRAAAE